MKTIIIARYLALRTIDPFGAFVPIKSSDICCRSLDVERLSEQSGPTNQVDLKSSSSSMAGSDDSLDKSDLDENTESQDHYKPFQNSPIILELGQKIGSDRSAFVRHGTSGSSGNLENRQSPPPTNGDKQKIAASPRILETGNEQSTMAKEAAVEGRPAQPQRKRNPYSIEELLKKDEGKSTSKRPKLTNLGVVQPCGTILNKEI